MGNWAYCRHCLEGVDCDLCFDKIYIVFLYLFDWP